MHFDASQHQLTRLTPNFSVSRPFFSLPLAVLGHVWVIE
jgi:hypothetical protein